MFMAVEGKYAVRQNDDNQVTGVDSAKEQIPASGTGTHPHVQAAILSSFPQ